MRIQLAILLANTVDIVIISITRDASISFLTDLGDRGGETAISSICRAALAISAGKSFLPEQLWIDGDVHVRPAGDVFSARTLT